MNFKRNLTVAAVAALLAVPAFSAVNANADSYMRTPTRSFKVFDQQGHQMPFILHAGESYKSIDGVGSTKQIEIPGHKGVYDLYTGDASGKGAAYADDSSQSQSNNSQQSDSSSDQSSSNNSSNSEYQNQNTNHGKLVQTGEHSTARKAGIAAIVIALVAFVAFKVRKVAKRN